jgi:hypothetical protein
MQENAGFNLNCTANDVQIARATNIQILDDGCAYPGDTVTFSADFEVVLTATARHDLGIYFAVDGDPNHNGAVSGTCQANVLKYAPSPWVDLDGINDGGFCQISHQRCSSNKDCGTNGGSCNFTQDLCGDINQNSNPLFPNITTTALCIDSNNDGKLNFPYCTSWRQPGSNTLCISPSDAFPGSPAKCRCDLGFQVDIPVPPATISARKYPQPSSVNEPGGSVTYTVEITNNSPFASVTISSLVDDRFGSLTQVQGLISATDCMVPFNLAHGQTTSCSFIATVTGNGASIHHNNVTIAGSDENHNPVTTVAGADLPINDIQPSIVVTKTANKNEVLEPGELVTFTIAVNNLSTSSDPVILETLSDSVHGDLDGKGTCDVPQTLTPGGSYSCEFSVMVQGNAGGVETNLVTAIAKDDEGNSTQSQDSETVNINDVPSKVGFDKAASPAVLNEPGGSVTYTFTVTNESPADTVTITALNDATLGGNLHGQGNCALPQSLLPGESYSCMLTTSVSGNAGSTSINTAQVSVVDDDGHQEQLADSASVNFVDVPPSATLKKEATEAKVTYKVTVKNTSSAENLVIATLHDSQFGDITQVQGAVLVTTCTIPTTIAIMGQAGDTYVCSFTAQVTSSPHTNTVVGTIRDDENGTVQEADSATVSFE